jgi:nucleotide-binding universal stress UspA family protein
MKILLPVDGSRHSLNAVRYVAERLIPANPDAELYVLHVRFRTPPRGAAAAGLAVLQNYYRTEMEQAVESARGVLDRLHVRYKLIRSAGRPGAEIARVAEANKANLVVMGSHGRGAATSLFLGSTTQGVIAGCDVPLIVIRDNQLPPSGGEVLVAVDGSAHARKAAAYLLRYRGQLAASSRVTLIHVSPTIPQPSNAKERAAMQKEQAAEREHAMRDARRLLAKTTVKVKEVHVIGEPGKHIADYAWRNHCSLIVLGSHGRGRMSSLILGSVAQKTVAATRTPVLIVR